MATGGYERTARKLRSTVHAEGVLRLEFQEVAIEGPEAGEVLVEMEAAPVHPADVMVLLAGADVTRARAESGPQGPALVVPLSPAALHAAAGRLGQPLDVGLEGAGLVVAAGKGGDALLGKRVALLAPNRGTYAEYCQVPAAACLALPAHIDARGGAAAFTNPLTALAMVETLHQTGERAMVHTAAASVIGQMLVRLCAEEDIGLVSVVRHEEQVELLRAIGARHVFNSNAPDYEKQLQRALAQTGARVAFDAVGGGDTASTLLSVMEAAAAARMGTFDPYGSSEMKRVYIYGRLDASDTRIPRGVYGLRWSVEGWAMPPVLERAGEARKAELMSRISDGLDGTFASSFHAEISLAQMLDPQILREIARHATGGKYLLRLNYLA